MTRATARPRTFVGLVTTVPLAGLLTVPLAVLLTVVLAGCIGLPLPSATSPSRSSTSGSAGATGASVAPVSLSVGERDCGYQAATDLRSRSTVAATGRVTVGTGAVLCARTTLYRATFQLAGPISADPALVKVGDYDGTAALTVALEAPTAACSANAVFAVTTPNNAASASIDARADVATLPGDRAVAVISSSDLTGRRSLVVAAVTKSGDALCPGLVPAGLTTGGGTTCDTVTADLVGTVSDRITVDGSTIAIASGTLPCDSLKIWVGSYDLSGDPLDDQPAAVAKEITDGGPDVSFVFPAPGESCRAAAAYLLDEGATPSATDDPVRTAMAAWPKGSTATIGSAAFRRAHPQAHILLGLSTSGPGACSNDTRAVSTPIAKVGDCWQAVLDGSAVDVGQGNGYKSVACTGSHTHEVYWAETPKPADYEKASPKHTQTPTTWARKRSTTVCDAKQSTIRLASGVRSSSIGLSYLWPTDLIADPTDSGYADSWAAGQIICLVHRGDNKPTSTKLLR